MWTRIKFNDYSGDEHIQASCYIESTSLNDAVEEFLSNYLDVKKRDIISVIEEEPFKRTLQLNVKLKAERKKKQAERSAFLKSLSTKDLAMFLKQEEDEQSRKEHASEGGYL